MAKKYSQGENITRNLSASGLNRATDAGEWYAQRKSLGEAVKNLKLFDNGVDVQIRNDTGSDLSAGSTVAVMDYLLDSPDNKFRWFAGEVPANDTNTIGITLQPIPDGDIGPARVSGIAMAYVYFDDADHKRATITAAATYLTSAATLSGDGVKVVAKLPGTGLMAVPVILPYLGAAAQNYVEYTVDTRLVGFDSGAGSSLKLNAANLTGWSGSFYRAGSESDVGIEYQTSETAPDANGLYKATRDGLFRLTLQGYWKFRGLAYPSTVNQDSVTTGPASAGTAHTHSVQQTGHDMYILNTGPKLAIQLFNKKASGGANALAADAAGSFFVWQHNVATTGTERYVPVAAQWNVCLHENDKLSLKWIAATMTNHEWTRDGDPLKLRFEYIGPIAEWAAI